MTKSEIGTITTVVAADAAAVFFLAKLDSRIGENTSGLTTANLRIDEIEKRPLPNKTEEMFSNLTIQSTQLPKVFRPGYSGSELFRKDFHQRATLPTSAEKCRAIENSSR